MTCIRFPEISRYTHNKSKQSPKIKLYLVQSVKIIVYMLYISTFITKKQGKVSRLNEYEFTEKFGFDQRISTLVSLAMIQLHF